MRRKIRFLRLRAILWVAMFFVLSFSLAGKATAQPDYTAWADEGVVFEAPAGSAYYPSVLFDPQGFGAGSPLFKMWYGDGSGNVFLVESPDGDSWGAPVPLTGLGGDAHHAQVLYDGNCFGRTPCGPASGVKYQIWYWDVDAPIYSIDAIAHAESTDGVNWAGDGPIGQDPNRKLVIGSTGDPADWNQGSYGPISVRYRPGAPEGDYAMYYDATDGAKEITGLAHSADGTFWAVDPASPVLAQGPSGAWDDDDAVYGTVFQDAFGFHYFYSGGSCNLDPRWCPVYEGIGYAFSPDGKVWTKDPDNPIFHITDGAPHRAARTYTPAVVDDGSGALRMYYSAQSDPLAPKKIGLARLELFVPVAIDIRPGDPHNVIRLGGGGYVPVAVLSDASFDAPRRINRRSLRFGPTGEEARARRCWRRDVDRDGFRDLVCRFRIRETGFRPGDEEGVLKGTTLEGTPVEGRDSVNILSPRRFRRKRRR